MGTDGPITGMLEAPPSAWRVVCAEGENTEKSVSHFHSSTTSPHLCVLLPPRRLL